MVRSTSRSVPASRLLAAALALAAAPAFAADTFSRTVFFGDSLTDAGYFRPLLVQQDPAAAILGRFTTNPGLVWAEWLADYYGTDATPNGNGQSGEAEGILEIVDEGFYAQGDVLHWILYFDFGDCFDDCDSDTRPAFDEILRDAIQALCPWWPPAGTPVRLSQLRANPRIDPVQTTTGRRPAVFSSTA